LKNVRRKNIRPHKEVRSSKAFFVFRDKRIIWNEERTVLVFISDSLKEGQIRGLLRELYKTEINIIQNKKLMNILTRFIINSR
jgi:hypothetical protein